MKKHIVLIMNILLAVVILGAVGFTVYNIVTHPAAEPPAESTDASAAMLPTGEATVSSTLDPAERYKIGIVQHSNNSESNDCYAGFISELNERGLIGNVDIVYIVEENEDRCQSEMQRLIDEKCDLLCTIGPYASTAAAALTTDIPIVFAGVADPESAGLIRSNENPGGNITGVSSYTPAFEQIDLISVLLPQVKKLAAVYCSTNVNAVTQAVIAAGEAEDLGITAERYPVTKASQIDATLANVKEAGAQAIYLPVDKFIYKHIGTILNFANENKIPVIVGNELMLREGAFATCTINYISIGRKAAGQAYDILFEKKDPASLPIIYKYDCYNFVNQASLDALGIQLTAAMRDQVQIKDYTAEE